MIYQDTWRNGKCIAKGQRNCEDRYIMVNAFCSGLERKGFTVLDVGANMCYFGLRLAEDFNARVIAFEFNSFKMRNENVKANKTSLIFLERKLSLQDLDTMGSFMSFDVVLAMSVIHHLPGDTQEWLNAFRKLGKHVIVEFALNDSTRPAVRRNYYIPEDGNVMAHADSHLDKKIKRPIVHLKGYK